MPRRIEVSPRYHGCRTGSLLLSVAHRRGRSSAAIERTEWKVRSRIFDSSGVPSVRLTTALKGGWSINVIEPHLRKAQAKNW